MCGCKGICTRYKALKDGNGSRYANGQRRCQVCELFLNWPGLWCPCCNYRLRTKPRNLKYKKKLREAEQRGEVKTFGIDMKDHIESNEVDPIEELEEK